MAVRISDKQAKEGMMKTFHLVKKVATLSTLAVFAFTVIPQSVDAARPSSQISKQQRTGGVQQSLEERQEMEKAARDLEAFHQIENPMDGAAGFYIDYSKVEGGWLKDVPRDRRTSDLCMKAVRENGLMLREVPPAVMSEELCLEAVRNEPVALENVPQKFMTPAVCMEAVGRQGTLLNLVPESMRSHDVCRAAVMNNGDALEFVPNGMRTPDICLIAVGTSKIGGALGEVPAQLRTKALCLEALKANASAFGFVPANVRDSDVYALALAKAQAEGKTSLVKLIQTQIPASMRTEVLLKATKINIADVEPK